MDQIKSKLRSVRVLDLGLIDYQEAYQIQLNCVQEALGQDQQTVVLCEHPAVLTLGRLAEDGHILYSKDELVRRGVSIHRIDRGGEVTLHAPGQLVVYPILNLNYWKRDLHAYLHQLEEAAIDLLKDFGIVATRISGKTGVWVGREKIVSMGVGVKKWITYHGLAINVSTDLNLFSIIRPCGMDVQMTSIERILHRPVDMNIVKQKTIETLKTVFDLEDVT